MPETEILPEIAAAAKWWADLLREHARGGIPRYDNNDPSTEGGMAMALMTVRAANTPGIEPEQIDAFEAALATAMMGYVYRPEDRPDLFTDPTPPRPDSARWGIYGQGQPGVDYGPDTILCDALDAAGIAHAASLLPWKTMMSIAPGSLTVRHVYSRAEPTLVYPRQENGRADGSPESEVSHA